MPCGPAVPPAGLASGCDRSPPRMRNQPLSVHSTGSSRVWRPSRSEERTSELQSLMRISYAVFCLKKKKKKIHNTINHLYNERTPINTQCTSTHIINILTHRENT